ncbi:uncharacterized protein L3040_000133 [Drepanopeziza brunnea f. sp. 'multigermtubi']|uniref:Integral membrane protein n=1 Tax=Marssonina brunnea f. sp. multigermtubi (strain MB_m1) TaxID=1072389 RepID=K1XPY8_MARBU|nr:uncharacterized protein MBM_07330 [Drepanopeziza brunnea f. sp. 'multigermtubi' MB_m1]EKD14609.1 hypothetical protein MBM_07330 [Drepanopeziza brunnea f. sp. 'multigermtubi' MB_m1]KAJ5053842.1 hypothetical protein L3040_000133 [Drepanopeziza brunnea f. sp. 'multigermtubi']
MIKFLPDDFEPLFVSRADLVIASIAWGFTLGSGFLTTWTAVKQTTVIAQRYGFNRANSPYIFMVWGEILVSFIFSIICWLYLNGTIPDSFTFFFIILTTWALQVQLLLQIIVNRVSLLLVDQRQALRLKICVAVLTTAINISVYCIWIPARLQISKNYIYVNEIWDRCEKSLYLVIGGALNLYFNHIVKQRLVRQGLVKYDRLVRYNQWLICLSLSMDCLIIGTMSLNNSFVYMQFHPVAYMVKLKIEMSMAEMIAKIASADEDELDHAVVGDAKPNPVATQLTKMFGRLKDVHRRLDASMSEHPAAATGDQNIYATREVSITVERRKSCDGSISMWKDDGFDRRASHGSDEDMKPLKDRNAWRSEWELASEVSSGLGKGLGMTTTIWGSSQEGKETSHR